MRFLPLPAFTAMILLTLSSVTQSVRANDYPTLDRVDNVLTCMAQHGGQTVENMYSCSCKIDVIANNLPLEVWEEAKTFATYKRMPGEKGGLFRDSDRANDLIVQLEAAEQEAEKRCFVGRHHQKSKKASEKETSASAEKTSH